MNARQRVGFSVLRAGALGALVLSAGAQAQSADSGSAPDAASLRRAIEQQTRRLEDLQRELGEQQKVLNALRQAVNGQVLEAQRGTGTGAQPAAPEAPGAAGSQVAQAAQAGEPAGNSPVGQAPEQASRAPEVAPIFESPGVLTPKGKLVVEPSLQYAYSSSNRVSLVGYTIIPAIAVGLINVQEEKNNTFIGTLTTRYGFTNRWEGELRVPYVYRNNDTVSLPFDTGSATATPGVYGATGKGLGDIEFATRYQFNDGGAEKPYYIGSLRFKTRTGTDPFQVENLTSLGNQYNGVALQSQLPTGSGFYSLQPGLTVLYPSDPVVFFGGLSYLHNFKRTNVYENTDQGNTYLGTVSAGDVATFNFGMGLALNSRSSFSIGYEQDSVGKTLINGSPVTGTTRIELGTLLLGYSYRLSDSRTLNIALGVGVTRDTPDVTLTFRLPMSF